MRQSSGPRNWPTFPWWAGVQQRFLALPSITRRVVVLTIVSLAVLARYVAQTLPYNYDFQSYLIVSETILAGGSAYETYRYNYGPAWFLILAALRSLFDDPGLFRLAVTAVLTVTDLAIARFLWVKGFAAAAMLFLLLPVSISISGNHHQFDNLALLLGFWAAHQIQHSRHALSSSRRFAFGLVLLSASLIVKHVLIVFPIWLAIQERGTRRYLLLCIPPALWFISLIPSLLRTPRAVIENVFLYSSFNNAPLANLLLPSPLVDFLVAASLLVALFLGTMVVVGFVYRELDAVTSVLVYSVAVLLFSSAVADQYLAIPLAAMAVFLNVGFALWLLGAVVYFWGELSATAISIELLRLPSLALGNYQTYQVVPLLVGAWLMHSTLMAQLRTDGAEEDPRSMGAPPQSDGG